VCKRGGGRLRGRAGEKGHVFSGSPCRFHATASWVCLLRSTIKLLSSSSSSLAHALALRVAPNCCATHAPDNYLDNMQSFLVPCCCQQGPCGSRIALSPPGNLRRNHVFDLHDEITHNQATLLWCLCLSELVCPVQGPCGRHATLTKSPEQVRVRDSTMSASDLCTRESLQ